MLFHSRLVKSLNPTGVLAVYIKSAKDLKREDSFFKKMFGYDKPDTYVKTQLGMAKFQTEPVMNDASPTFKAKGTGLPANWFELPLDTLEARLFGPVQYSLPLVKKASANTFHNILPPFLLVCYITMIAPTSEGT